MEAETEEEEKKEDILLLLITVAAAAAAEHKYRIGKCDSQSVKLCYKRANEEKVRGTRSHRRSRGK
jgi:hypothetical protein